MMQAKNIHLKLGSRVLLEAINLTVQAGEVVVLLGANGAGKSSLLHILAGSSEHDYRADELSYDGQTHLTLKQLAQRRAVLSQHSTVPFELLVEQVVEMGLYPFTDLDPSVQEQLLQEAMQAAGIERLKQRQVLSLSGGEQQRTQFARVLVQVLAQRHLWPNRASYLFLDEPLNALDPKHQQEVLRSVRRLAQDHPIGVLMVLHDVNLAAAYADRLILLHEGSIIADAPPKQALSSENLYRLFGLSAYIMEHPLNKDKIITVWRDE